MVRFTLAAALLISACTSAAVSAAEVQVVQKPVKVIRRSFDPAKPPKEMPKLGEHEAAVCHSDSSVEVLISSSIGSAGEGFSSLTVTGVRVELKLTITVWTPNGAPKELIDHEEAHRKISEHYYRNAAEVVRRVGAPYIGEQAEITAKDRDKAAQDVMNRMAHEITAKYQAAVPVEDAQKRFDAITQHGTKSVPVDDAMKQAIAEAKVD